MDYFVFLHANEENMTLAELKTGEKGVIVKVAGHGGFRKRIIEMGFVKGKTVDVLLNAPLQDPVKYKIMGYEVSLRRQEAQMIEVVSYEEAQKMRHAQKATDPKPDLLEEPVTEQQVRRAALEKRRTINVALIGNPNCGKTSLFNFASGAHGHVGNYSGVTVDASEAHASFFGYEFNLIDLPGTYSLSCYSPEELYVRRYLNEQMPDSPDVSYRSVMSVMKCAVSAGFPLCISYLLIKKLNGANDGLVWAESAKHGQFRLIDNKSIRGISHGDVIDLMRENIEGYDVREFYTGLVAELKTQGF